MRAWWLSLFTLPLLVACGPYSSNFTVHGDVQAVSTGRPGEYYLIDGRRGLCFFHTTAYGRSALAQIDCYDVPEAREILGLDEAPAAAPDEPLADPETFDQAAWRTFHDAFIQYSCDRRADKSASLAEVLTRYELDEARYNQMLNLASHDSDYWGALSKEVAETCTAPSPSP